MAAFANPEDVGRWLVGKPCEVATVLAARVALRVIPLLSPADDRQDVLRAFRSMQAAWAVAAFPGHASLLLKAAQAAGSNLEAPHASEAQAAAEWASAAAGADVHRAGRFAEHATKYAIAAAAHAGDRTSNDILSACGGDAEELAQGTGSVTLANTQLWPGPLPVWVRQAWVRLKTALPDGEDDWVVWTDWYEERLKGREADQTIEVARATIPNAIWDQGPKVVNDQIRRWYEERGIWRYATAGLGEPSTEAPDGDDDLEHRLAVLSIQEVAVIGARAALRALPLMSFGSAAEPTFSAAFLKMLRITSLTWAAAAYPTQTPNLLALNAARIDAINSRVGLVRAAAAAAAAAAYSANQFDKILEEVARGIRALRTASSQLDADAAAAAFDLAVSQDLNDLLGAPEGSASVAQLELWPGGAPPDWMARRWDTLKRDLIHAGVGWEIWADWYEHRLAGRTRSEAHELAYVEVPDGLWEQGMSGDPAVVNTWIMRRFDQFADIPEIPRPGPGPRFQASQGGPIDRAPTSDVDEGGNDIRTINQLKPLVQQCVSALRAGLSRNEAPHLLRTVELYEAALNPPKGREEEWGELWGLGVMLQNAASAHERQITHQLLPPMEDTVKAALDSLLALHGPLILATSDGARLSAVAHSFAMSREEQAELRGAAEQLSQQLQSSQGVIMPRAAASIADAAAAIGEGKHPERGSVYGLATIKNVSIILIGGAAAATPAVIGALLGSTLLGAIIGSPLSLLAVETVKKNSAFTALVTQLGAKLETMSDVELRTWLEEQGRRFLPFRSFVISNEEPLRKIATSTNELKWMLRYIDFVVGKERL